MSFTFQVNVMHTNVPEGRGEGHPKEDVIESPILHRYAGMSGCGNTPTALSLRLPSWGCDREYERGQTDESGGTLVVPHIPGDKPVCHQASASLGTGSFLWAWAGDQLLDLRNGS